jgi:hypothetical protein
MQAFWEFIRQGGYALKEVGEGPRNYYRFQKPSEASFPLMLELFSRTPAGIAIAAGVHLTPIPAGEEASSLSAILIDEDYYSWVMQGRKQLNGFPFGSGGTSSSGSRWAACNIVGLQGSSVLWALRVRQAGGPAGTATGTSQP